MNNLPVKHRIVCTAATRLGNPCRAWAVPGSDPPRCAAHGGASARPGAPAGNRNAVTHGIYAKGWYQAHSAENAVNVESESLMSDAALSGDNRQVIALVARKLLDKYLILSDYIDRQAEELPLPVLSHLLSLHAQMASRLGRLFRDQRVLAPPDDGISRAIDQAMVELSEILGTDLT